MEADILKLDKFITVVQPNDEVQERFSAADMWNAVRKLQLGLAEETSGRLVDQEAHESAVAKLEKRLTQKEAKSPQDDVEALRLEVRQLEQRLGDEVRQREEVSQQQETKSKQQEGKIKELEAELKLNKKRIAVVCTS